MKKALLMILSLILCVSLCSCCCTGLFNKDEDPVENNSSVNESSKPKDEKPSESKGEVSKDPEPVDPYADAKAFIEQGKYAEAYAIFYAAREDEEAAKWLGKFVWKYSKSFYDYRGANGEHFYDSKGNLISEDFYEDGEKYLHNTYTYNEKDLLVEKTCTYMSEYGNTKYIYKYTYDSNGNITKETRSCNGLSERETTYEYNSDGKLSIKSDLLYYNDWPTVYRYAYDNSGTESIFICNDGSDNYVLAYENRYDTDGNPIRETNYYDYEGSIYTSYTYNDKNQLIKKHSFDNYYGTNSYVEYSYNEDGLLAKEKYSYSDSYEVTTLVYTYDDFGNLLTIGEEYSFGTEPSTTYSDYKCYYLG